MANVSDAMRKHQAEQTAAAPPAGNPVAAGGAVASSAARVMDRHEPDSQPGPAAGADAAGAYAKVLTVHHDRGGPIAEQYRSLRTSLLAQYVDERFSLVVTSAERGEGKTVTCLNLALVLAERPERRTIIVDCDLRRGQVAGLLGASDTVGVADVLEGTRAVADVIQPTVYPNLFFITAGQASQDGVARLLGKPEVNEMVAELRTRFDHVLFDAPPISAIADAGVLGRAVGEALLVLRMGKTPRDSADRAIRLLKAANAKLAGVVLTHQKFYIPGYLYRYS